MTIRAAVAVASAAILVGGCRSAPDKPVPSQVVGRQAEPVADASSAELPPIGQSPGPEVDARHALARNDRHLVGFMGYGFELPGVPRGFDPDHYAGGIRTLLGVTDASDDATTRWAQDYATRYNRVILGASSGGEDGSP